MRIVVDLIGRGLWVSVVAGVVLGLVQFAEVLLRNEITAPQQAAGASMACAFAILPYAMARAWDEIVRPIPRARAQQAAAASSVASAA